MSNYIYIAPTNEDRIWTVGFYNPVGEFEPESDHDSKEEAAERVAFLNGGGLDKIPPDEDTEPVINDELRAGMKSEAGKSAASFKKGEELFEKRIELLKPHPDWETRECSSCGYFWHKLDSCRLFSTMVVVGTPACPKYHPRTKQ